MTPLLRWAVSENQPGLVSGVAVGTAKITATRAGVTGSTIVTVTPAVLTSIAITPPNPSTANGFSVQITATGTFSDFTTADLTNTVSWTSSDDATATVNPTGRVTGTGVGSATITATQAGVSGSTSVTVTSATLSSILVAPANPSIAQGNSVQLTATGTFSDATAQDLTKTAAWHSSSPTVAVVGNAGIGGSVTTISVGTATITATKAGVSGSTTVTVTPAVLASIVITPVNPSLAKDTTVQLTATGTFSDGTTQDLTATGIGGAGRSSQHGAGLWAQLSSR